MNPIITPSKASKPQSSPSNRFTVRETSRKSGSQSRFDQQFRPTPFLAYKQKKMLDIFTNEEPKALMTKTLGKKYFGKKVKYILRQKEATKLHQYSRYFHHVLWISKFEEPGYWGRLLNNKRPSTQNIANIRFVRDIIFMDKDVLQNHKYIFKLLLACNNKTSIGLRRANIANNKDLVQMPKRTKKLVKYINIQFEQNDVVQDNLFADFDQLVVLSLIFGDVYNFFLLPSIHFFIKIVQIKTLQTFSLDFTSVKNDNIGLKDIFTYLEAYNIPKWHIKINYKDIITNGHDYDFVLSKVDCLAVNPHIYKYLSGIRSAMAFTYRFQDLKYLYEKRKKVLEVQSIMSDRSLNDLLDRFNSLESLYIVMKDIPNQSGHESRIPLGKPQTRQNWTHNLKDVVLNFNPSEQSQSHLTFRALALKIYSESRNLESLQLFSWFSIYNRNRIEFKIDIPYLTGIESLTSLQCLQLLTSEPSKSVGSIVERIPNLTKFEFISFISLDAKFPFQTFSRVKELKLNVKGSQEWWTAFLQNLESLKGLEVLEIQDQTTIMSLKMLKIFLEKLMLFRNLRKLTLEVKDDFQKAQGREEMSGDIRCLILRFIETNMQLQEMNIEGFIRQWTRYVKYKCDTIL